MVLLITGGSLGHIVPALSFYHLLKAHSVKAKLLVEEVAFAREVVSSLVDEEDVFWLPFLPSPKKDIILWFRKGFWGVWEGRIKEIWTEVDRVVYFGSSYGLGLYLRAIKNRLPFFLHEQNAVMGNWNLLFSVHAKAIFYGFGEDHFPRWVREKAGYSSNLPFDIYASLRPSLGFGAGDRVKVLVLGGTRGAQSLNTTLPRILSELKEEVEVIHISGDRWVADVKQAYALHDVEKVKVVGHIWPVYHLIREADVVVCRAGAMTLTELAMVGRPAVVVPYPHARAHQRENARYFGSAVITVGEKEALWEDKLRSALFSLVRDELLRRNLGIQLREKLRWPSQEEVLDALLG